MDKVLYLVVPCYNEEEVLRETASRVKEKLMSLIKEGAVSGESRVCFVNDGSKDKTWEIITDLFHNGEYFAGVNLSRNRGHQNAILAGMMTAKTYADYIITMDADLQDDINALDEMVGKANEGADIVYGVRSARKTDTFFKRFTAEGFYKVMKLLGVDIVFNHADYRLMTKRVVNALEDYHEVNLFLRGIIPLIGFKSDVVYYERAERFAGESKYPLKKMLSLAFDGVTSFSLKPLKLVSVFGGLSFLFGIAMLIYALYSYFSGISTNGWASLMCAISILSGLNMFFMGIVGEYVGKIYLETKQRPRYIVEEFLK
ncbi:glycosyl transferase [Clostridia bacterium]|nr:glycosyl transferase [Clostridia bacterium]